MQVAPAMCPLPSAYQEDAVSASSYENSTIDEAITWIWLYFGACERPSEQAPACAWMPSAAIADGYDGDHLPLSFQYLPHLILLFLSELSLFHFLPVLLIYI